MSNSGGEIEWSKTTQGWVLSAFFYGYLVSQVPCGILAGRFGGKRVMLYGVSLFGVTTLLVPLAARYEYKFSNNLSNFETIKRSCCSVRGRTHSSRPLMLYHIPIQMINWCHLSVPWQRTRRIFCQYVKISPCKCKNSSLMIKVDKTISILTE